MTQPKPKVRKEKGAQERLDKALKAKKVSEDLGDLQEMVETLETGKRIGAAAVDNPVLGVAIALSAAYQLYQMHKKQQ